MGELVIAVGNPLGFIGALTTGVVHSLPNRKRWLAADVRLAPGNSGGPLADAQGRVIGINTMIAGGLALAVPSNAVGEFLSGRAARGPVLGVTLQPVPLRSGAFGFLQPHSARDGQHAAHGSQAAVQSQLAEEERGVRDRLGHQLERDEQRDGDRQVERGARFRDIRHRAGFFPGGGS